MKPQSKFSSPFAALRLFWAALPLVLCVCSIAISTVEQFPNAVNSTHKILSNSKRSFNLLIQHEGRSFVVKTPKLSASKRFFLREVEILNHLESKLPNETKPFFVLPSPRFQNPVKFETRMDTIGEGIVFPFHKAGNLKNFIFHNSPSMSQMLLLATDIAKGLQAMADLNMVHGDIKLSNILLTIKSWNSTSNFPRRHVASLHDFEGAFLVGKLDDFNLHTSGYNAPDCIRDLQSDIYSFGVLLLSMLTRQDISSLVSRSKETSQLNSTSKEPTQSNTYLSAFHSHYNHHYRIRDFLEKKRPSPPKLYNLLDRCLQRDFEKRPTAADLVKNLKEIQTEMTKKNSVCSIL